MSENDEGKLGGGEETRRVTGMAQPLVYVKTINSKDIITSCYIIPS